MTWLRRFAGNESGVSIVEFAVAAPLFLLIVFGIIEGGTLLWTQMALDHGVAMGARCASVNSTLCGTTADVQTYAAQQSYGLNPPTSTFSVVKASCGNDVSASYTYHFISGFFGPSVVLSARSCFP